MGLLSSLEIGRRALMAQRSGLDITSNNIANVNTPGYSRRTLTMKETDPLRNGNYFYGTGVIADKLRSFRQEFFDTEIRKTVSRNTGYSYDKLVHEKLEAILAEPSENGIGEKVNDFFNSFTELASKPESIGHRQQIIGVAKTLTERFHTTAGQFQDARRDTYTHIQTNVDRANGLIEEIAYINKALSSTKSISENEIATYIDQRAVKLEELAEITGTNVTYNEDGSANVFVEGIAIVSGPEYGKFTLKENINSGTGEATLKLMVTDRKDQVSSTVNPQSGEFASQLKAYNIIYDDVDSSGEFSAATELNRFAAAIAEKVNDLAVTGWGLNDVGAIPPGRSFFEPYPGTVTAMNIEISADILADPSNIPLAAAPGVPGNSDIARAIARIAEDNSFLNGQKPSSFYADYVGRIGRIGKEAGSGFDTTSLVREQLESQRESIQGVNLDEEAINLVKYQKAFEASSRIINVTNEILQTIINLGR